MSSGNSKEIGYRIEVRDERFSTVRPVVLHDGIVGPDWREVSPIRSDNPAGVPVELPPLGHKDEHRLLEYEGAVALAWTIIAHNRNSLGLRCRIVRFALETTYKLEREGVVDQPEIQHALFQRLSVMKPEEKPTVAAQEAE